MVRIVFVMDNVRSGNGTSVSGNRSAEALRRRGHEVRWLAADCTPGPGRYRLNALHIPVAEQIAGLQHFSFARPDRRVIAQAIDGADVVHLMVPTPLSKAVLSMAQDAGIPATSAFHVQPENITYNIGLGAWHRIDHLVYALQWRHFFRHITHVHCPTRFIANELVRHGFTNKLHVISNGAPDEFAPPAPRPPVWTPDSPRPFRIVNVGRLSPEKRQEEILAAVSRSRYRDRIEVLFAGRGPQQWQLKLRAMTLPNRPRFAYLDPQQLIGELHAADLYVHAAEAEIESMACLEAVSCGLVPVIAHTRRSAASQFALDDHSLYRGGSARDLSARIDYWIEHPRERRAMSEAYAQSAEKYRLSRTAQLLEEMFIEAIADARLQPMGEDSRLAG